MQFDFVYADLQVQVKFMADGHSPFCTLSDREVQALQQLVYMTLNAFHFTRALYAADAIENEKQKQCKTLKCPCKCHGG